ncbi:MAG: beta-ketoacyl synthase chain length factor [Muribaculaceae bacterium]|nr:beta-ketoacyl synthase chain length factor [Muribaculaceae bacterium]
MPDMSQPKIYIQAAEQVSIQQPLSQQWMSEPILTDQLLATATVPNYRDFIDPREARRMGGLIKRALVTTLKVLRDTGIEHPDAFITGTSIGSLDYTERFLDALDESEEALSPTYFMQSPHNTVGSALAIHTRSHGYNTTYSHGACSFDWAVMDAWMQMQLGKIRTALVGGYEEMTQDYFELLQKTGYVGQPGMAPCAEMSMSMMLNTQCSDNCLCQLAGVAMGNLAYRERMRQQLAQMLNAAHLTAADVSAVMTGKNGNPDNDACYDGIVDDLLPGVPLLRYKHLFGENYTASAMGVYAAAHCLAQGMVPDCLQEQPRLFKPCAILLVNQMDQQEYSLMLLTKI